MQKTTTAIIALFLFTPTAFGAINPGCNFMDLADCNSQTNFAWVTIIGKNYMGYCGMTADYDACDCVRDTKNCTKYRCAGGTYGTNQSCTSCPSGGTSADNSTAITSCYIPSGTAFSDTSGTGTYTQNCYYQT
ncbi:MAG: hypothetical protein K2L95_01400 [Alphaproteobacteria bacterium]|nr:hypothetical protein [Alphaproteobacteria bacterium]MDE6570858.1 hypothetical protein [Alphaproteobacteria bacterium]